MDNPMEWVASLNAKARRPDLNIYFRISPASAVARVKARGGPEEIFDAQAKQEKIAEAYEVVAARNDIGAVRVVDAEASMDEVSSSINGLLRECLGLAE